MKQYTKQYEKDNTYNERMKGVFGSNKSQRAQKAMEKREDESHEDGALSRSIREVVSSKTVQSLVLR